MAIPNSPESAKQFTEFAIGALVGSALFTGGLIAAERL